MKQVIEYKDYVIRGCNSSAEAENLLIAYDPFLEVEAVAPHGGVEGQWKANAKRVLFTEE